MAGDLDMGHARALLRARRCQQILVANEIVAKKLSVREAEGWSRARPAARGRQTPLLRARTREAARPARIEAGALRRARPRRSRSASRSARSAANRARSRSPSARSTSSTACSRSSACRADAAALRGAHACRRCATAPRCRRRACVELHEVRRSTTNDARTALASTGTLLAADREHERKMQLGIPAALLPACRRTRSTKLNDTTQLMLKESSDGAREPGAIRTSRTARPEPPSPPSWHRRSAWM